MAFQNRVDGDRSMSDEVPSAWRSVPLRPTETGHVIRGMQSYYDDRAEEYDDWYRRINKHYDPSIEAQWHAEVAQLTQWIQAFGHGRLLEIASGTGWWTRHLARRAPVM